MPFLKNTWYVAAWADEITRALLARQILGDRIVLYRKLDGSAAAVADRCPHRFAPLSMGKLVDDTIECAYHGLRFDCSGKCTFNPHGNGMVPPKALVRSFPVAERYKLLWIWMGEPEKADESAIPEFDFLVDPKFQNVKGYTLAEGHYELMTDNIMDLGHIEFLHPGLLGSEAVRKAKTEIIQRGNTVFSNRLTSDEVLPPVLQKWYEAGERTVQRWLNVRWDPGAIMKLTVGVLPDGEPQDKAHESQGCHLMTPATETTTHYFWAQGRNWGTSDPAMDSLRLESLRTAFDTQDKPMIEAVQRNMGTTDLDSLSPVMLSSDGGPVRARRVLKLLIAEEARAAAPLSVAQAPIVRVG
ncbi:aromatic ring-hydroxylating dioxygenase subunit alpha [Ottowia thiooxydans]|uniref:Phenylpropionate dioxygenase-like ring-hydroxylating dioxygenase large terminal subunit n=1 Tax=Ottowia thiooxydans TaxID=219182 RepID=A0ABV2Q8Z7_9BURK